MTPNWFALVLFAGLAAGVLVTVWHERKLGD